MNILLGLTGSVATVLAPKLVAALKELRDANVRVILTDKAMPFIDTDDEGVPYLGDVEYYTEKDEWVWRDTNNTDRLHFTGNQPSLLYERDKWQKTDPVLHIELRKWADCLVIAPLSANTLAKMANGICDNLLTSVIRAWDWTRPVVVAPAMNTYMWESPFTKMHLDTLYNLFNISVVPPVEKELACGDVGVGAMAGISDIVNKVKQRMAWQFPLANSNGIPVGRHPGAFGYTRHYSYHTGVDLYTKEGTLVYPVEDGVIVGVEGFTGPQDNSPWWNNTNALLVAGKSGTVCYGEIDVFFGGTGELNYAVDPYNANHVKSIIGKRVCTANAIGVVKSVVKEGRERPDIPGHSRAMMHVELYTKGHNSCSHSWKLDQPKPDYLLDPTSYLLESRGCPNVLPEWEGIL